MRACSYSKIKDLSFAYDFSCLNIWILKKCSYLCNAIEKQTNSIRVKRYPIMQVFEQRWIDITKVIFPL